MLAWDIETGPEEESILKKRYIPFDKSSVKHPGEFDPTQVKYGNTKDAAKRAAILDENRAKHADAVKNYNHDVEKAAADHWKTFVEKAALHPLTGRLLAFGGKLGPDKRQIFHIDEFQQERSFLIHCWDLMLHHRSASKCGWNIHGFDLPFLILRSAKFQVDVPTWIRDKRQFFDPTFVDLEKVWTFPRLHNPFGDNKLNTVAQAVGIGKKPEGVDGADFHRLYFGTAEERQQAFNYLNTDLDLTWDMAGFLQVL